MEGYQQREDWLRTTRLLQRYLNKLPEEVKTAFKLRYGTLDFTELLEKYPDSEEETWNQILSTLIKRCIFILTFSYLVVH